MVKKENVKNVTMKAKKYLKKRKMNARLLFVMKVQKNVVNV